MQSPSPLTPQLITLVVSHFQAYRWIDACLQHAQSLHLVHCAQNGHLIFSFSRRMCLIVANLCKITKENHERERRPDLIWHGFFPLYSLFMQKNDCRSFYFFSLMYRVKFAIHWLLDSSFLIYFIVIGFYIHSNPIAK